MPESRQAFEVATARISYFFSLNWIFESDHPFIDKPMVINCSRCTKHPAIRPGFQTVSWQHAAHALKVIS